MFGLGSDDEGGLSDVVSRVATTAKVAGKSMAVPAVKKFVREKAVAALNNHDPDELEGYILVDYPLIREELDPQTKEALGNACPQFAGAIQSEVTPENVMMWLRNPEEWMDDDTPEETLEEVRRVAEVIESTPGGQKWLEAQVLSLWDIGSIL